MVRRLLNYLRHRRTRLESELDRELQYHIDHRIEELVSDGVSESEALRVASSEIGGRAEVSEAVRETWTWPTLDGLLLDFRYAIRSLIRSRGFAFGTGGVLALTIGASITIFAVVNTVLLRPLPYPDSARIVAIETIFTSTGQTNQLVSTPDFLDWQAQNDVFENMAAFIALDDTGTIVDGRAMFSKSRFVSPDFFSVFGQTPSAGRLPTEQDALAGGVAVVAHPWAVTHFGSADAAIGETFLMYGGPVEIVGVTSPGFRYPSAADLWLPFIPNAQAQRDNHDYQAAGKLKQDVPFQDAEVQMRTIGESLAQLYPENRGKAVTLVPLQDRLTGGVRVTLWVLMSAVGFLWLISCANIANLLLARAASRTRELAVRAALGAGRWRVVQRLLTETLVLSGLAGLVGLVLAFGLIEGVVAFSPDGLPRINDVRIDTIALVFAIGLSLLSTMLFGLMPAVHASRHNLSDALKESGLKATATRASARLRSGLVVAEVALSVVLLATAGLLVRSFEALQNVDLGFETDRVLAAYTEYATPDLDDIPNRIAFFSDVLDRLRAVPGVEAAAGAAYLGMGWEPRTPRDVFIEGRLEEQSGGRLQAEVYDVTEDFFKTLDIPTLAGRDFDRTDTAESPRVAIINESLARIAFPAGSPVGQRIRETPPESPVASMEIVGVVGDARWQDPSQPPPPVIFRSAMQGTGNSPSILVRTSMDGASVVSTLRQILNDTDPTVPVEFETLEGMFGSTLAYPRFRTQIIGLFASFATVLAAVGIISVLAYLVGLRTRELALRQALGAKALDVVRLILGQGLRLVVIGLALGLAGAAAAAQLLTSLLYEISPWDVTTYIGTIVVLGSVALVAILVPALKAGTIAPVTVLQQD